MLALTWYDWFKAFNVIAAVLWVGGGVMLTTIGLLTLRVKDPRALASFGQQAAFLGERFFAPASLLVLAFGFAMMENGSLPYDLIWVQIALVGWGVTALVGFTFISPNAARISRLIKERGPEDAEVQARIKKVLYVARFDAALLLFIVFDMTAKPWS